MEKVKVMCNSPLIGLGPLIFSKKSSKVGRIGLKMTSRSFPGAAYAVNGSMEIVCKIIETRIILYF
jgi:hypothetical protein